VKKKTHQIRFNIITKKKKASKQNYKQATKKKTAKNKLKKNFIYFCGKKKKNDSNL